MGPVNCAVINCTNNSRKLSKWKATNCEHDSSKLKKDCECCHSPFRLFCFPGSVRYGEQRRKWIQALRRENADKSKWEPSKSDRVCSDHFVDKIPTEAHPIPTLNLGYLPFNAPATVPRRPLFRKPMSSSAPKKPKKALEDIPEVSIVLNETANPPVNSQNCPIFSPFSSPDHEYSLYPGATKCNSCIDKNNVIKSLSKKVAALTLQNNKIKKKSNKIHQEGTAFNWMKIKTDKKMNFYTGITTRKVFHAVFKLLFPYTEKMVYWQGTKHAKFKSTKLRTKSRPQLRKLSKKNEFLLTLIKLRLDLLNEDLADRFHISTSLCSQIFKHGLNFSVKLWGMH